MIGADIAEARYEAKFKELDHAHLHSTRTQCPT
jgi:hypothetical protein